MNFIREEDTGAWRLEFAAEESKPVSDLLLRMLEHYQIEFSTLPEALQRYWRGCLSKAGNPEELKEAREHLQEERLVWRGERMALLEKWYKDSKSVAEDQPWTLALSPEEFESLLVILNDRRLMLATQYGMNEEDLENAWTKKAQTQDLPALLALQEIEMLGNLQYILLGALHPDLKIEEEPNL